MVQNYKIAFIPFKHFLALIAFLFAVAATFLIFWFTSAATATGSNPATAISLAEGVNTGLLGPGEQRWFRFVPSGVNEPTEKSVALAFTPANNNLDEYVSLQLFEEKQLQTISSDEAVNQGLNFGIGHPITRDNDPATGELLWTGQLSSNETYYIQLANNSDFLLDYWLSTEEAETVVETIPEHLPNVAPPVEVVAEIVAEPAVAPVLGLDPGLPLLLSSETNTGRLKPNEIHWYTFTEADITNGNTFQDLDLSLFFTPDDGNRRHNINFELFSANETEAWWRGDKQSLVNFGAGMLVSRDGNFSMGERIWRGNIIKGDTYYVAVQNGSEVEIDYWLFNDDIFTPEFGEPTQAEAPTFAQGAAPVTATPLDSYKNTGGLNPGEEAWYSFSIVDNDSETFEEMALTMIVTPDDGNRIRYVPFDVFTAQGVHAWSPGNLEGVNNVGAGSIIYRDNNDLTGERFWSGWVVDNDLYYVRIRNGSDVHINYWLFNGDVYQPELE